MEALPTSPRSRTAAQAERVIRNRRRTWITGAVLALVGIEVAAFCVLRANADAKERWRGPLSIGYSHCASELEPLRDASVRFTLVRRRFPRSVDELRGSDSEGQAWIEPGAAIDDALGGRIELRTEETDFGPRCSAWTPGPNGRRGDDDDVSVWSVLVSFGEIAVAVPHAR